MHKLKLLFVGFFTISLTLVTFAEMAPSCIGIAGTSRNDAHGPKPDRCNLVAHACGIYNGMTYTNSLDALETNYAKGFRLFEVDFNLTRDDSIVLIHDWNRTAARLIGSGPRIRTLKEFEAAAAGSGLRLMDLKTLVSWLEKNKDAYIVTDCKVKNLKILKKISREYPGMTQRLIPQMGPINEYGKLKRMGYGNIILALYKTNYSDKDVVDFVGKHEVMAVSMTQRRAESGLPAQLNRLGVKVFAHTVNSYSKYKQLLGNGVYGIYTDSIKPAAPYYSPCPHKAAAS